MDRNYTIRVVFDASKARADMRAFRDEVKDTDRAVEALQRRCQGAQREVNQLGTASGRAAGQVANLGNATNAAGRHGGVATTRIEGLGKAMLGLGIADAVMDKVIDSFLAVSQTVEAQQNAIKETAKELAALRREAELLANLRGEDQPSQSLIKETNQFAADAAISFEEAVKYLEEYEEATKEARRSGRIREGGDEERQLQLEAATAASRRQVDPGLMNDLVANAAEEATPARSNQELIGRAGLVLDEGRRRGELPSDFANQAVKTAKSLTDKEMPTSAREAAAEIAAQMQAGTPLKEAGGVITKARAALAGGTQRQDEGLAEMGVTAEDPFKRARQFTAAASTMIDADARLTRMGFDTKAVKAIESYAKGGEFVNDARQRIGLQGAPDAAEFVGEKEIQANATFRRIDPDAQALRVEGSMKDQDIERGEAFEPFELAKKRAERILENQGKLSGWGNEIKQWASQLRVAFGGENDRDRLTRTEAWQQLQQAEIDAGLRPEGMLGTQREIMRQTENMGFEEQAKAFAEAVRRVEDAGGDPFPDIKAGESVGIDEDGDIDSFFRKSRGIRKDDPVPPLTMGGNMDDNQAAIQLDRIAEILEEQLGVNRQLLTRADRPEAGGAGVRRTTT